MKKIVLLCSVGYSTSLLMAKMKQAAVKRGFECEIEAYSIVQYKTVVPDADVVLVGPQIRYEEKRLKDEYPDKIIYTIDLRSYGTMDGETVMKDVIEKLK